MGWITIVMEIDGWEVYIIMFWDHVGGFMKKKKIQKIGHNRAPRGACTWLGARGLGPACHAPL